MLHAYVCHSIHATLRLTVSSVAKVQQEERSVGILLSGPALFLTHSTGTMRFLFDGRRIEKTETPKMLEMEDQDLIHAEIEQVRLSQV